MNDVASAFVAAKPGEDLETRTLRARVQRRLLVNRARTPPTLGRYVVPRRIGQGGLGVVYAAYDPQLERRVAIKVMRTQGSRGEHRAARQSRLIREA